MPVLIDFFVSLLLLLLLLSSCCRWCLQITGNTNNRRQPNEKWFFHFDGTVVAEGRDAGIKG